MKVSELIEELLKLPQDYDVECVDSPNGHTPEPSIETPKFGARYVIL